MQQKLTYVGSVAIEMFSSNGWLWCSRKRDALAFANRARPIESTLKSLQKDFGKGQFNDANFAPDMDISGSFQVYKVW